MKKTIKKIKKNLHWKEKVIVCLFPKTTYKIYRMGINDCFKWINQN